jgi:four helix bundle protein
VRGDVLVHHAETRIYSQSLELISLCVEVMDRLPGGFAFLADQLRRASSSVTLNFCEGCGRTSRADRTKFFTIARASANEVAAALDVAHRFRVATDDERERGRAMCNHIAAMLFRYR